MQQVYASVAHLPDQAFAELGQTLNVAPFRNPLPSGSAQMGQIMNGSGLDLMTGLGQQYLNQNRIFATSGAGFASSSMASNANSIAGVQAMASQLYQSAAQHMSALQGLETLLAGSPDTKDVADITARVQTEQTYFAAQQVQGQAMANWQTAQVRNTEQQRRESRRCYIEAALHNLDSGSQDGSGSDSCAQPAGSSSGGTGTGAGGDGSGGSGGGNSGAIVGSGFDQFAGQSVGSGQCVALVQASDVWNGRIVSEATLSSRLNAARTALGDTGAEQRLIRTLPRKGVRFVGEVREMAEAMPGATDALGAVHAHPRWPMLAVLPFANMSGDPAQDYFAEGMAEEIIAALSRSSGLLVIARNSSFTYKGPVDVRQVGQELGAGYVLEGSVRRDEDRLRIAGLLVDAATGAHLWSDRFEGGLQNVFELQDSVAGRVAAAIEPELQSAEIGRLSRSSPTSLDSYDLLLRAYALLAEFTPASMQGALNCLDQALAIDPGYASAMAAAAYGRAQCHVQGWAYQDEAGRAQAVQHAWRATELAPNDNQVLWMAAFAIWNMAGAGRDRARVLFRRSLLINPNSAMALTLAGWIETMCGNVSAGREMVERARWLNPRDPRGWLSAGVLAIAALAEEDYAGAADWAECALAQNRRFAAALRAAAVAAVKLGRPAQARDAVRDLLAVEPGLTVSDFFARIPVPVERMVAVYKDGLRAAGLPD